MNSFGKFKFVQKYPFLFSLIVTIGLEISKFIASGWASYIETWNSSPILKLVVLLVQFLIMFLLVKGAIFFYESRR